MKFKVGDIIEILVDQAECISWSRKGDRFVVTSLNSLSITAKALNVFDEYMKDSAGWMFTFLDEGKMWKRVDPALVEVKTEEPAPESENKVLNDKIAKMEKQIKLLKIMLQAQGYESLAIASALELLD